MQLRAALLLTLSLSAPPVSAAERPNILWITCEDASPDLGCYGDAWARTPNLDRFASEGVQFSNAFAVAGVCAPSRSAIVTGMYPTTIGTHHMRCKGVPPAYVKCFTEYLRAAGYFCTNNVKTDYNFDAPLTAWDENSRTAHWRNRPPGKPFFSVFNITITHESQIRASDEAFAAHMRRVRPEQRHDPADAKLPPYYPDTPLVRKDWARYCDLVTAMDARVGEILKELEEDKLADKTIVFFYGDHGRGLPRAKRWIYDSGIRAPLLVRWPGKLAAGSVRDDLVSFIDLAPTVLTIAGTEIPKHLQGQVFLGEKQASPRPYVFAHRDRMDETYDIIRAVRDRRFKYIRNFQPGKPYAQYIDYMDQMPTMKEMRRLNKAGELVGPQKLFFLPEKPVEELYDITQDPHEVNNLAGAAGHAETLQRMRGVLEKWMKDTGDLGLIPEDKLNEERRPGGKWATTAAPVIEHKVLPGGERLQVTLTCPTDGASIAWTNDSARWNLYAGPFEVKSPIELRAKACRLGYKDSAEVKKRLEVMR